MVRNAYLPPRTEECVLAFGKTFNLQNCYEGFGGGALHC